MRPLRITANCCIINSCATEYAYVNHDSISKPVLEASYMKERRVTAKYVLWLDGHGARIWSLEAGKQRNPFFLITMTHTYNMIRLEACLSGVNVLILSQFHLTAAWCNYR